MSDKMHSKHSVFVLGQNGQPLTPTTPSKARKLLAGGVAKNGEPGIFGSVAPRINSGAWNESTNASTD